MRHSKVLLSFAVLGFVFAGFAKGGPVESELQVSITNLTTVAIKSRGHAGNITLKHSIDGYEASCDKQTLVIWGKPKKLNRNSPQDSELTVINLQAVRSERVVGFGKGIHEVEFLREKPLILVYTDNGAVINFATGAMRPSSAGQNSDLDTIPRELCDAFASKTYRRYKD